MMMKKKQHAFTLIEVLVVIAIIAILIAILIPSMLYVRKQARKASLLSQASRLQQSIDHYISEYGATPAVYTHAELKDHSTDVTQTENAFFSLMGGLVYDGSGDPPDIAALAADVRNEDGGASYDVALLGVGATEKDETSFRRQAAFFKPQKNEMQNTTGTTGEDNFIPDLVDPVNGQPLLIYTPGPYPVDGSGYARHANNVIPVSWDDSKIDRDSDGRDSYGLIWRRLNDDFASAPGLTSGGSVIDQSSYSLLSDKAVSLNFPDQDETNDIGANSNLSWFVMDWAQIADNSYYWGNPNHIRKYDRHKVTKGYWILSPGYDGVYLSYEDNEKKYSRDYKAGFHKWSEPKYPVYSDFETEREKWFENKGDRLIFAHRWFHSSLREYSKDSIQGRADKAVQKDGHWNEKDGSFGKRSLNIFQKNFDDIILEGGALDGSIENE